MQWSLLIVVVGSAAAGVALGRVISRRVRILLLIGGLEAATLGLGLQWLAVRGVAQLDAAMAAWLALLLIAIASVVVPLALGAWWAGP